ncbi:MAG TPA: hypothetical protein DEF42_17855 [Desulfosporosinus sp.]|nr:hypothetical protein [Desulfosporosinus sp.]
MKKIKIAICCFFILTLLLPGRAMATTYNNDVPSDLTLLGWSVNPNNGGKSTSINFLYTGRFSAPMGIDVPFDSSWHSLDDVRPILLAEQKGYGNYLGGTNGSFGSNIKFSDNVLAAMKVQDFNPSQVGGANIPPSSTTLNSDQIAWLQKVGYSVQLTTQTTPAPMPTPTPEPTSSPAPQTQTQNKPSSQSTSSNTTSTPAQQSKADASPSTVRSNPAVGETVKTDSGPMTQEMVVANQELSKQNPPDLNPTNIPTPLETVETEATPYKWTWITGGAIILILAAAGGMIHLKHRNA